MKLTQHFFPSNSKFRRFWTSIFTNSYNFLHLAQIFGIFKQKQLNLSLNQTKYWPNWPDFCSNSVKFQPNSSKFLSNSAKFLSNSEFRRVSRRNRRKNPQKKHCYALYVSINRYIPCQTTQLHLPCIKYYVSFVKKLWGVKQV